MGADSKVIALGRRHAGSTAPATVLFVATRESSVHGRL